MQFVFPFRNLTINTLLEFFQQEKVSDYSDIKSGKNIWKEDSFNSQIAMWKNGLPNFENELLQVINTTSQESIDEYFRNLVSGINYLFNTIKKDYFNASILKWNEQILLDFSEYVNRKSAEYFNMDDRKRKHLEEYEDWVFDGSMFGYLKAEMVKVKKVNYNFYCVEATPELISLGIVDEYFDLINALYLQLVEIVKDHAISWLDGKLKSKIETQYIPKPIVFVEGEHDITFIKKAAELLNKQEVIKKIELRQRGGYRNLDKLWDALKEDSWEIIPQKKIFLYDCDTRKVDEDFGVHFKRTIPTISESIIMKGIENLFPVDFIQRAIAEKKAFVDFKKTEGVRRGEVYVEEVNEINKDEKKNFCNWACENGSEKDFAEFIVIFKIIEEHL